MPGLRHSIVNYHTLEPVLVVIIFVMVIVVDALASVGKDVKQLRELTVCV
jgi:hypothetical protein